MKTWHFAQSKCSINIFPQVPLEVSGHQPVSLETTAPQPVATKKRGKKSKPARHSPSFEEKTTSSSDDRTSKEESSPGMLSMLECEWATFVVYVSAGLS